MTQSFLLIVSFMVLGMGAISAQSEKLYYAFDPLCGWCFAFSPEMEKIAERYGDQLEIVVLSGGMVTGDRIGPIGESAAYIKEAYKTVEEHSGIEFGQPFLDHLFNDGSHLFSSLEPSIALAVIKDLAPKHAVAFASDLHHSVYVEGLPPADFESYVAYAKKYGIDRDVFLRKCRSAEMEEKAKVDFSLSSSLGVTGFPTLVYYNGSDLQVISRGYMTSEQVAQRLDALR